jgi:hypothetical protein
MFQNAVRDSKLWVGLNVAVIVFLITGMLFPQVRNMPIYMWGGLVIFPSYLILLIRKVRADGSGDRTIPQLYEQAKAGQKFPRYSPLENLTLVVMIVAFVKSMIL